MGIFIKIIYFTSYTATLLDQFGTGIRYFNRYVEMFKTPYTVLKEMVFIGVDGSPNSIHRTFSLRIFIYSFIF